MPQKIETHVLRIVATHGLACAECFRELQGRGPMVLQDHAEFGMGERSDCMPRQGYNAQEKSGKKGLGDTGVARVGGSWNQARA